MASTDVLSEPGETLLSPGRMIREARDAAGMTAQQLAAQLNLDERRIAALEADDFDQLAPPTFVKGYLRAAARLLDLEAPLVLEAYSRLTGSEEPGVTAFSSQPPLQITSQHRVVQGVTWLVVVASVVLAVAWWQSQVPGERSTADTGLPTEPATPPLPYTFEQVVHPDELPPPPPDITAAGEPDAPEIFGDGTELVIEPAAESWMEITDASGEKLFYGIAPPGRTLSLSGQPPYQLRIGASSSVSLRFRGEAVDLAPYAKTNDIAVLELGAP
ncbi:MAG: DUF4115 domain-containing protein [Gammaproteobacteria bacterium]|nr:DUF4115 domain-containing protein [Gammaproteobacteria bacterium]NNM00748.1 DUF4115 domain-containing protein [Gammaproteobacteria bacterium]